MKSADRRLLRRIRNKTWVIQEVYKESKTPFFGVGDLFNVEGKVSKKPELSIESIHYKKVGSPWEELLLANEDRVVEVEPFDANGFRVLLKGILLAAENRGGTLEAHTVELEFFHGAIDLDAKLQFGYAVKEVKGGDVHHDDLGGGTGV